MIANSQLSVTVRISTQLPSATQAGGAEPIAAVPKCTVQIQSVLERVGQKPMIVVFEVGYIVSMVTHMLLYAAPPTQSLRLIEIRRLLLADQECISCANPIFGQACQMCQTANCDDQAPQLAAFESYVV
jgi:hypothetical protein